jgi:hypothetical protein
MSRATATGIRLKPPTLRYQAEVEAPGRQIREEVGQEPTAPVKVCARKEK